MALLLAGVLFAIMFGGFHAAWGSKEKEER